MSVAPKGIRQHFRFGLKSIIALTTVVAMLAAVITQPYRHRSQQQHLVAGAKDHGASFAVSGCWQAERSLGSALLKYFDESLAAQIKLYEVQVPASGVTDELLANIAQIEYVQRLHLQGKCITDQSLRFVAGMKRLRTITLTDTAVTQAGITHLAGLKTLVAVNTGDADISYAALNRLDSQLPLAHLCEARAIADLQAAGFQVPAMPQVFEASCPGSVEVILDADRYAEDVIIGMNREIHFTADEMVKLSYLQRMRLLDIHEATFDAGAFDSLRPLKSLRSLSIVRTAITDDDLHALSRQSSLQSLEIVQCDSVTDAGLLHLASLAELVRLRVSYCAQVTGAVCSRLQHLIPECDIEIELADAQR